MSQEKVLDSLLTLGVVDFEKLTEQKVEEPAKIAGETFEKAIDFLNGVDINHETFDESNKVEKIMEAVASIESIL